MSGIMLKSSCILRTNVYFFDESCYTVHIYHVNLKGKRMSKQQEREQKILAFMRKELKAKGYPPTVREIGTALGIKSTSTVHKDIASLVEQGYLKKDPAKPRALMLVDSDTPDTAGEISNVSSSREDVVDVPVVGNVAAGTPILAEENIEDTFPVPAGFVKGDSFMLKVRGESMVNAGIMDCVNQIAAEMKTFLERTPPQISYHISREGIHLTGGSTRLPYIDNYLASYTGFSFKLSDLYETSSVNGLEKIIRDRDLTRRWAQPVKQRKL